ncbi:MAG: DNA cytosine methyltransferase, partial [Candidatus Fonsibacter sp.]
MEPLPYMLDQLGLHGMYGMEASCEVDARRRQVVRLRHKGNALPKVMFKDISRRPPERLPDHDLYVAGFPCQPLSPMATTRLGRQVWTWTYISIRTCRVEHAEPRAFLLDNVKALMTRHR